MLIIVISHIALLVMISNIFSVLHVYFPPFMMGIVKHDVISVNLQREKMNDEIVRVARSAVLGLPVFLSAKKKNRLCNKI